MSAYIHLGHVTLWLPIVECELECSATGCWRVMLRQRDDRYRRMAYASADPDAASRVRSAILAVLEAHRSSDGAALARAQRALRAHLAH